MIELLGGKVLQYIGDVRAVLAQMDSDSVDCCVTSPPYWGLRDYGADGQIGLEKTMQHHIEVMVDVFEHVRRVLKPTGTLWLNYGDCYATTPNGRSAMLTKANGKDDRTFRDKPFSTIGGRLKPKDLVMMPNRVAIALQDAGWWVRSEIIWGKNNPMPDSAGAYRPSTAHEKIFMLAKTEDGDVWRARDTGEVSYCPDLTEQCPLVTDPTRLAARWTRMGAYYDAEAVKQESSPNTHARMAQNVEAQRGSDRANGGTKTNGTMKAVGGKTRANQRNNESQDAALKTYTVGKQAGHGKRHAGFNERYFAEKKPKGSTPRHEDGINHVGLEELARGEGRFLRNYEPAATTVWAMATQPFKEAHFATFPPELAERCILAGCPKGGLVLDPFGGAGTTALVALRHGRRAALIDINPEYAEIAQRRIENEWKVQRRPKEEPTAGPLFGAIA